MSDSIVPASGPEAEQAGFVRPGLGELFVAFVKVALSGFGGALPWARRMIVDQKRWMTTQEFNETFALSQFLPGPNVDQFLRGVRRALRRRRRRRRGASSA